jgi:hypothetical protein
VQNPTSYDDFEFVEEFATAGLLSLPAPVF